MKVVRRWHRVGTAVQLETSLENPETAVGWEWEIARDGGARRRVRVEVELAAASRATDLPAASKNAIRSRGATAVDLFLAVEEPPERLIVSRLGVRAQE